jgi:hypothetical protein
MRVQAKGDLLDMWRETAIPAAFLRLTSRETVAAKATQYLAIAFQNIPSLIFAS